MLPVAKKTKNIHIAVILDKSGSMDSIRDDVIGGYNAYLKDRKEEAGNTRISLTMFDTAVQPVFVGKDITHVPPLGRKTYIPGGSTALLDAIASTVSRVASDAASAGVEENIICLIMTDGYENSSRETTNAQVRELIQAKESEGWMFVYLGANQDAWAVGGGMGVKQAHAMSYDTRLTREAYAASSENTRRLREAHATGQEVDSFWRAEDAERLGGKKPGA